MSDQFAEMVRLAMYGAGEQTIKLGNVEFFMDGDEVCYDLPCSKWNKKVTKDLIKGTKAGLTRAADAMGME